MTESASEQHSERGSRPLIGNVGESIKVSGLQLDGVSAEPGRGGDRIKIYTRLSLTSDDRFFHRVAEGFRAHIEHVARGSGRHVNLKCADTVLLVAHPDNTGELWVDSAAVAVHILTKRSMAAGSIVFESDIADVTGMSFPLVPIGTKDRVVCLFRGLAVWPLLRFQSGR